ncbi:MAG: ATP-dependent RNA helicase RhlE [uncultured Sulfurovum sp.]|uniref:ATP-dependent RNA helicase RhlE n=1 Tax=uncultured Sulfurovum sp. TaxID=269237 RepID=A0A6S6T6N9_9BACT|nr:MAG: ATP-dependent RNA helicase RhlE [uncultured Sulfurovum sp.]
MSFKTLKLSTKLLQTLQDLNYDKPTEIQEKSIPLLLAKKDILATSQTGTGKTASFVLPMLENLEESTVVKTADVRYKMQALILAPTRELVIQIHNKIEAYAKEYTHSSVALYGGIKLGSQISAIRAGANIAVGTTGRVLDHIKNGSLNLDEVEMIVLDEADKMLEMGFIDDIRKIIALTPKTRHSVMFSATFPKPIMTLAKSFLRQSITIEIDKENLATKQVRQMAHYVNEEDKMPLLCELIVRNNWHQVLVFTNTKLQADKIVENLKAKKIKALAIHGDKSQGMRKEALDAFKLEEISVLVATDVAARGLDIINLPYVINFELALNNEDYIHRIGRTGRAGKEGMALSLICEKEKTQLTDIETLINKKLEIFETEGFMLNANITLTNRKVKKEIKKKSVNMKKAKELADKMMKKEGMGKKGTGDKKKSGGQKSINKRHF